MSEDEGDDLGLNDGFRDVIALHDGTTLTTHGPALCLGRFCAIHKPSDHPLKDAPLVWVPALRLVFRVCEHKHIHPDPDALDFHAFMAMNGRAVFYDGYHPCCDHRCCIEASVNE